jgi:L-threonylcarbamoyladenylate synthase
MTTTLPGAITVEEGALRLARGELVSFPTETVYGLGADATNPDAVSAIFSVKQRPPDHPVIVHISKDIDPASYFAEHVPRMAYRLIERFWPGPLTLILRRQPDHAAGAAAGQHSIGLRSPDHPLAQELLLQFKSLAAAGGLAAPSANRFGRTSPTTAAHVRSELGGGVGIIDGGPCRIGIESTILDMSRYESIGPVLLRPGSISERQLAEVLGSLPRSKDAAAPRVSGSHTAHYAPSRPLYLVDAGDLVGLAEDVAVWSFSPPPKGHAATANWKVAPATPEHYAIALYRVIRAFDAGHARALYIERPPKTEDWGAVNDRLGRAASPPPQ